MVRYIRILPSSTVIFILQTKGKRFTLFETTTPDHMDAFRSFWIFLGVFLVTNGAYNGTTSISVEQYVDKIIQKMYDEVQHIIPEDKPVMLENVEIFLNESSVPTTFGIFSLGKFSGLGTKFNRTGACSVRRRDSEFKVTCKVGFRNLQATLPKNIDYQYVLLINTSGDLIIRVPNDERNVTVGLMTLSEVNFTMQKLELKNGTPVGTATSYISDEQIPTDIKTIYRLVFQKFITEGKFKNALDATLASVRKVSFQMLEKKSQRKKTKVRQKEN